MKMDINGNGVENRRKIVLDDVGAEEENEWAKKA